MLIKQSAASDAIPFQMIDSSDHITGKTGLTPTVTIRKAQGTFAAPAGAIAEVANGWYELLPDAADSAVLGPLLLHATASGADPCDVLVQIVGFNPRDTVRMGMTALPNAAAEAIGGIITRGNGPGQLLVDGEGALGSVNYVNDDVTGKVLGNGDGSLDGIGVKAVLDATGLNAITVTALGGVATTFPQMVVQLWRRFFKKSTLTATQLKTYGDDGTTVVTTQTVSDDGTTQTQGTAS